MKIGIIGMGSVGSSVAISILQSGIANTLMLNDLHPARAEGEVMDLSHGAPFYPSARVEAADVADMRGCNAVVICAGRGGSASESRLALLRDNVQVMRGIGRTLSGFEGIVVVVSNPVDILTWVVTQASGLPAARVIGTGTMLDTARLRQELGRELNLDARAIHAQVIGEHGDSEVAVWSSAMIGGRPLRSWPDWSADIETRIGERVRTAAYEIIRRKGATNHAIGLVTAALLRWVLRGERRALTVSRAQEGALGISGVALSLPTIVGQNGAVQVIEPVLDDHEHQALMRSAEILKAAAAQIA